MNGIFAGKLYRKQTAGTWRRGRQASISIIPTEIRSLEVHDEEIQCLRFELIFDCDAGRELTARSVLVYLVNVIFSKLLR